MHALLMAKVIDKKQIYVFVIVQILYDNQARSRSVSESASSDTTAPAGDNVTVADTSTATEDGAATQQSADQEVEGVYKDNG